MHEGSLTGGGVGNVYLQDDKAVYSLNNDEMACRNVEPQTPDSTNVTDAFLPHFLQQTPMQRTPSSSSGGINFGQKKNQSRKKSSNVMLNMTNRIKASKTLSKKPQRIETQHSNLFSTDLIMFYSTPITKYWLSLIFRLAYLTLFAYLVGVFFYILK